MKATTPIPAEFIQSQPDLNWLELQWGFDRGWLSESAVVDLAVARLSEDGEQAPEIVELASLGSRELVEVGSILAKLAETEKRTAANRGPERAWLRIILAWLFAQRDEIADPLGAVEEIYADFGYPPEISHFVRYMPPDDGYVPQAHTPEQNMDRLYCKWREFLDVSEEGHD